MAKFSTAFTQNLFVLLCACYLTFAIPSQASALMITNCTGTVISAQIHDKGHSAQLGIRHVLSPGFGRTVNTGSAMVGIQLFEKGIVSTLRVTAPSINARQAYSAVRLSNGQWQLVHGNAC